MFRQASLMIASVVMLIAATTNAHDAGYVQKMMRDVLRSQMDDKVYRSFPAEHPSGISSAASRVMADQVMRASADELQNAGVTSAATRTIVDQIVKDSVEDQLKRVGMPIDTARSVADNVLRAAAVENKMQRSGMPILQARSVADHVLRDSVEDNLKRMGMSHAAAHSVTDQVMRTAANDDISDRSVADKLMRTSIANQLQRTGVNAAAARSIADQVASSALDSKASRSSWVSGVEKPVADQIYRNWNNDDIDQRIGMSPSITRSIVDQMSRSVWQNQDD